MGVLIKLAELTNFVKEEEVINYTTIVRVNFSDFEDYEKCANDRASLRMENAGLAYILNKVNIVYVDNPPLVGRAREINKEVREDANNQTPKGQKVTNIHQTIANLQEQINEESLKISSKDNIQSLQHELESLKISSKDNVQSLQLEIESLKISNK
ncbi:unnamed protein product [Rhizophagus irregularis]|nr:unnamed protein product [Rhizophagus irregularis]